MKNKWIILILALATLLLSNCGDKAEAEAANTENNKRVTLVEIQELQPEYFANYLNSVGTVKARNHVQIMVEEGGILRNVRVDKGRMARKGDTLAVLENKMVKAGYYQALAALKQAQLNHKSREVLYSKKAISENEYLAAKYELDAARAACDLAAARHEKLFITAPFSGLVNDRFYDLGAYAQPMTPMFEQIDNQRLKISVGIAERFMGYINVGTPVKVAFNAFPDLDLDAKVSYISRSIDPKNRTFRVEVEIPNTNGKLAPEMIANVRIMKESFEDAIIVPIDALVESEGGWYVYVAEKDMARKALVNRQAIYRDQVLVDGLSAGQKLIVVGQHQVSNGDPIEISKQ